METKLSKEQVKDFKEHIVWRFISEWIEKKKEDTKNLLLKAKNMEEVIKLQNQYDVYQSILSKINSLGEKGQ